MNKKILFILSILVILLFYVFNVERVINNKLSALNSFINKQYVSVVVKIEQVVDKYLFQLDYIEQLKKQNDQMHFYETLYNVANANLNDLKYLSSLTFNTELNLTKTTVLRYYKLNDFSKVILDTPSEKIDKIKALITYDGYSAGIVMNKEQQSVAYLNKNQKCNYAVYIGEEKATGITSGMTSDGLLRVRFIPLWQNVKESDEVITSAMDDIFPYGIKVGKVLKIIEHENTKDALVVPYIDSMSIKNFYIY